MNGSRRDRARERAQTFAICMSDRAPSIIRAPPEHDTMMTRLRSCERQFGGRAIFSPDHDPMLPPMNAYSIAAMTSGSPSTRPLATITASFSRSLDHRPQAIAIELGDRRNAADRSTSGRRRCSSTSPSSKERLQRSAAVMRK
jgi:hypothetical protein